VGILLAPILKNFINDSLMLPLDSKESFLSYIFLETVGERNDLGIYGF